MSGGGGDHSEGHGGVQELGFLPHLPSSFPTLASRLAWHSMEARAAGAVGSFLGAHTACFVPTDAGVGGTAGQLGVWMGQRVDLLP